MEPSQPCLQTNQPLFKNTQWQKKAPSHNTLKAIFPGQWRDSLRKSPKKRNCILINSNAKFKRMENTMSKNQGINGHVFTPSLCHDFYNTYDKSVALRLMFMGGMGWWSGRFLPFSNTVTVLMGHPASNDLMQKHQPELDVTHLRATFCLAWC